MLNKCKTSVCLTVPPFTDSKVECNWTDSSECTEIIRITNLKQPKQSNNLTTVLNKFHWNSPTQPQFRFQTGFSSSPSPQHFYLIRRVHSCNFTFNEQNFQLQSSAKFPIKSPNKFLVGGFPGIISLEYHSPTDSHSKQLFLNNSPK